MDKRYAAKWFVEAVPYEPLIWDICFIGQNISSHSTLHYRKEQKQIRHTVKWD